MIDLVDCEKCRKEQKIKVFFCSRSGFQQERPSGFISRSLVCDWIGIGFCDWKPRKRLGFVVLNSGRLKTKLKLSKLLSEISICAL